MSLNWKYQESFADRHIGPDEKELQEMLKTLGVGSLDELIGQTVPAVIRSKAPLKMAAAESEHDALAVLEALAAKNQVFRSFIGMGYSDTDHAAGHPAQHPGEPGLVHPVHALPGGDRPGPARGAAQLPDDGDRPHRASRSPTPPCSTRAPPPPRPWPWRSRSTRATGKAVFFVSESCHPQTIDVVRTRAEPLGMEVVVGDHAHGRLGGAEVLRRAGAVPGHRRRGARLPRLRREGARGGRPVRSWPRTCWRSRCSCRRASSARTWRWAARSASACRWATAARTPPSSPPSTPTPASCRAASSACPRTPRASPRCAWRCRRASSTSAARRRRATSAPRRCCWPSWPACTPSTTGPRASRPSRSACTGSRCCSRAGSTKLGSPAATTSTFFDTLRVEAEPAQVERACSTAAEAQGMNFRRLDERRHRSARSTRPRAPPTWRPSSRCSRAASPLGFTLEQLGEGLETSLTEGLRRTSAYLTHPGLQHATTPRRRCCATSAGSSRSDLSLTHSMIPLGSCTMKLNATAEMMPVTWPAVRPAAPVRAARRRRRATRRCSSSSRAMLAEITGFAGVSLQPNAGSQGEYAGLLVIRAYHEAPRPGPPRRVPHPVLGARHQPGLGGDGRLQGGRRQVRRERQHRRRRTCAPRRTSTRTSSRR